MRIKLRGIEEEDLRVGYVLCSELKPVLGCRFFDARVCIAQTGCFSLTLFLLDER